ncbi:hypothetical protein Acsp03_06940 [Actinomadura sp. NBRC 104412]|uniref:DUF4331 domain-containing protein n=1 Tax=Actinomadura sp. NBRC 104412 TaxID=3032203 RepID=UPI0024A3E8FF|nr:DUF4331 domain-containing protein [Actinomadura sp. NBRC 104412]GLZ03227.1 hypothetical protein Acsp03_06940 [Actinomadura sp. NBRC 104412]
MSLLLPARLRGAAMLAAGAALVASGLAGLQPGAATASSHREAPLISGMAPYDNVDVYAFVSPDKPDTTTLIANFWPFEEPAGGPNFFKFATDARYEIHVDNDGDSLPEFTYRYTFKDTYRNRNTFLYNVGPVRSLDDPNLNFRQFYDLTLISRRGGAVHSTRTLASNVPVAPSNVGKASMPDYRALRRQAVKTLPSGTSTFAGQSDAPFSLDLRVFDLLYGGNLKEVGNDSLRGFNEQSIAIQVPTRALTKPGQPILGIYSSVSRQSASGQWHQVSRLGHPLVNEVVIPLKDKDKFNASIPWHDAQFLKYVTDPEVPKLIQQIYNIPAPKTPRNDLVQVFLTGVPGLNKPPNVRPAELMRLNTSIPPSPNPKRLGVLEGDNAGYPNGRRLQDDVIDITLQVAEGELVGNKNDLGDAVNANDVPFEKSFPYVGLPTSGSDVRGGKPMSGAGSGSGGGGKAKPAGATMINGGNVANNSPADEDGGSPAIPLLAIGAGAAFVTGGGLLWWRRRGMAG